MESVTWVDNQVASPHLWLSIFYPRVYHMHRNLGAKD